MKTNNKIKLITFFVAIALFIASAPVSVVHAEANKIPELKVFTETLRKTDYPLLVGLYVPDQMALPVVQQPSSNPGFVSTKDETLTQFSLASDYGTTGLLAHNYLAGAHFSSLKSGDKIGLVYGDGTIQYYLVTQIRQYQAVNPTSLYSNFKDLENPSVTLTSTDLFYQTYGLGNALVLQTCILANGDSSWGRLFIIAIPTTAGFEQPVKNYSYQDLAEIING